MNKNQIKNHEGIQESPLKKGAGARSVTGCCLKEHKGITLISLIITIIVMLILVSVTITMAINGGLFEKAGDAVGKTQNAIDKEQELGSGKVTIGGKTYESIDEYIKETSSNGERKMNIEYTTSEGNDLLSSAVTLNITFDEETEFTLDQKKEIVAYLFDCSSYDELKGGISAILGETGGTTNAYNQLVSQAGGENEFLDMLIDYSKKILNFDEVEKLESLGIKVISVETPYDTTLYTSSLGGEVVFTFVENGTHTFKIKSGTTEINQEVQINNIKEYDTEEPHEINIEFVDEGGGEVVFSKDDNSTWETVSTGLQECNSSISFKYDYENPEDVDMTNIIILDENFYKYYNSIDEYKFWNEASPIGVVSLPYALMYTSKMKELTPRQSLLYLALTEGVEAFGMVDYKMLNLAEEMLEDPDIYNSSHPDFPQYNIANIVYQDGIPYTINLTHDVNLVVLSRD